ncbi:hypothetical protein [Nocardia testacea]|uniref:hypothetical protein n=1 Tax=Nocardia testacea TaxID=248551 RepID=UPI003A8AD265
MDEPSFDVEDVESPRRNVLMFYGVGGIGKTTLSQQISRALAGEEPWPVQWPHPVPALPKVSPLWIDLSRRNGIDLETLILSLRVSVASMGHSMPAFDLAFRRYWDYNHPGESLEDYLKSRTIYNRFSASIPAQIDSILGDVAQVLGLPGAVGALVGKGLTALIHALRDRGQGVKALRCRRLADLLEAEPDIDALSYYPHLLAWDLANLPSKRPRPIPVVLLDTFEDVGDRTNRERERLIQRLIWLMPNALFILTGRNRLQWDDPKLDSELDWVGPQCWPSLCASTDDDPRQHLVGYLSPADRDDYLVRRLTRGREALIPSAVRSTISARSDGLPLYLDLAVMRFLTLYQRRGTVPTVEEFDYDFAALVSRTFRDLSTDERHVVRAVSLVDSFSVQIATRGAGLGQDSAALRLVERPFIESEPTALWPYRLHSLVRSAVRDAEVSAEEAWSEGDWRRAASRIFDALGAQWRSHADEGDPRLLLSCLSQGLRLARDFGLALDWLVDAAFAYVADSIWEPIELGDPVVPGGMANVDGEQATALASALACIARRNSVPRQVTAEDLRALLASGRLSDDVVELAWYFLAMCERDLGNFARSLDGMRRVADAGGRLAADARRGLLHLSKRLGRFRDALDLGQSLGTEGKQHRALGELWWPQGSIARACVSLAAARDDARGQGLRGEEALCQAYLAFAAAFEDRARATHQLALAERMLAETPVAWAVVQVEVARLLVDAGHDPTLPSRVESIASRADDNGLTSPASYARLAACLHAAVLDSEALFEDALGSLKRAVHGEEFAYLVEIAHMLVDSELPDNAHRADWIDSEAVVRARWRKIVADRRQELDILEGR